MSSIDMQIATVDEHRNLGKGPWDAHTKVFNSPGLGPIVCKVAPRSNPYGGVPSYPAYFRVFDRQVSAKDLDLFLAMPDLDQRRCAHKMDTAKGHSRALRDAIWKECLNSAKRYALGLDC